MYINPIDKDKVAENPGLLAYPHHIGSISVRPEDVGKLKSRALSAMIEQTNKQLFQMLVVLIIPLVSKLCQLPSAAYPVDNRI